MLADELQAYLREIDQIASESDGLIQGLSERQWRWRPTPGSWSVLECLSHLNLFGRQVEDNVSTMIQEARSKGLYASGPYRHGLLGKLLIKVVEPPYRVKVPAVRRLIPPQTESVEQVAREFRSLQGRLRGLIEDANGLDLGAVTRPLPPSNLRLTLGQWYAVCLAHERRHLWQANHIRAHAEFPR